MDRCTECGDRTTLPVLCKPCRAAFADTRLESCPWPEELPRVLAVEHPTRWVVPVPYVPDVTADDYEEN